MSTSRLPPNYPEDAAQKAKYQALCELIAQAKQRGEDFELRGAKQIGLYVHRTELKARDIFRTGDLPIERHKAGLRMSVSIYEWFVAERRKSAILGEDFRARLRRIDLTRPGAIGPTQPQPPQDAGSSSCWTDKTTETSANRAPPEKPRESDENSITPGE